MSHAKIDNDSLKKKSVRLDTNGWERWSTGNCARNWSLIMQTNVDAQPGIRPEEWDAQNPLGCWDTNRPPNLSQPTRPSDRQPKKKRKDNVELWI